jgi:hypothetical protein
MAEAVIVQVVPSQEQVQQVAVTNPAPKGGATPSTSGEDATTNENEAGSDKVITILVLDKNNKISAKNNTLSLSFFTSSSQGSYKINYQPLRDGSGNLIPISLQGQKLSCGKNSSVGNQQGCLLKVTLQAEEGLTVKPGMYSTTVSLVYNNN